MVVNAEGRSRLMSAVSRLRSSRWLLALVLALVLASAAVGVAGKVMSVGFLYEKNYNEGWNVYNTERLINHETIYDDNYWRVNNYPIFSFIVVAGVNLLVHDLLLSGRIVALISFFAVGALAGLVTLRLGGGPSGAVFTGACALGFYYLAAPDWIGADDPQSLAQALMLCGLARYVGRPPTRRTLLETALWLMLAGFTKQNMVAIPLAITLDLAVQAPRRLPFWFATCAAIALLFIALTQLIAGGSFLAHLLMPREYTWYNVRYHLLKFVRWFKVPLIAMALSGRWLFRRDRLLLAFYGGASVVAGALFSGFEGASYNMFQDAAVFLAIACGLMLHDLRRSAPRGWFARGAGAGIAEALLIEVGAHGDDGGAVVRIAADEVPLGDGPSAGRRFLLSHRVSPHLGERGRDHDEDERDHEPREESHEPRGHHGRVGLVRPGDDLGLVPSGSRHRLRVLLLLPSCITPSRAGAPAQAR
jgi:hypothetical protein